jgi:hypothetical protein
MLTDMLKRILSWPMDWWYERQRSLDLEVLWPSCRDQAPDLDHARAAFAYHAFHDKAWLVLGDEEIKRRIDNLVLDELDRRT